MASLEIDFDEVVGGEFDFYGVDGQRFSLDGLVYEVIEDDHCALFEVVLSDDRSSGFHELPIARVVVEHQPFNDDGYELVDLHDGYSWLCFGMQVSSDNEPLFVFEWTPKEPGD